MIKKMQKISKYIILFCLFLISYLFLPKVAADETWSYGFAYNIASGLIPYQDFNMIVPPVFALVFSSLLFFYKGILMFHIEQAIMFTIICYMLEKLLKEKSLIPVLLLLILAPMIYNLPTYNSLCFLETLLLIILEKQNKDDLLIGIVAGLAIFTKQSIGFFLLACCLLLVRKEPKRIIRRVVGVMIITGLITAYLLLIGSFPDFLDQCILGLFDFSKNGHASFFQPIFIICFFVVVFFYLKKITVEKEWYYAFAFYSICFPLCDLTHFLMGSLSLLVVLLAKDDKALSINLKVALCLCIVLIPPFNSLITLQGDGKFLSDLKNHEYRYLNKKTYQNLLALREYYHKHKNQEIIILSTPAYLFKLTNNLPINKLDLINVGNWGRNGTEKIITEIEKRRGSSALFLVYKEEAHDNQIDKEVLHHVRTTGKKVDKVLYFDVYQLN